MSKGVPALLVDLKADVYCDSSKIKIVEEFLLSNLKSIQEKYTFVGDDKEQDPTVELWLLYFVAQHYYFLRNFDQAFFYLNQAIEHTPTVVELYILKAKIYKRVGDTNRAATLYDEARKLDLADRYLNAVASRYRLRND